MLFPPPSSSSSFSSGQECCPATLSPLCRADLEPSRAGFPAGRNTRSRRTNPTCVGDRRRAGGADAVGPGHYAAFPGIFHEERWKKRVPGSAPRAGCDRAQGREGRPRAAAATHDRGWRGPGTYQSPGHCHRRPRPPARGRRAEETRQRGWGGDRGPRPGAPPAPRSFGRPEEPPPPPSAAPPGPVAAAPRPGADSCPLPAPPCPRPGAHPARPPRAPSRRAALRPRGTRRPGPTRSRPHLPPRVLGRGARRLRHLPPARSCDRRGPGPPAPPGGAAHPHRVTTGVTSLPRAPGTGPGRGGPRDTGSPAPSPRGQHGSGEATGAPEGAGEGTRPAHGHALQEQPLYCHPAGLGPAGLPRTGGPQGAPEPPRSRTGPVLSVPCCSVRRLMVGSAGRTRSFMGRSGRAVTGRAPGPGAAAAGPRPSAPAGEPCGERPQSPPVM